MIKGEDYIVMSLPSIIVTKQKANWSNRQIGNTIGVTPLQVSYYGSGKTKLPSPIVCKAIFDNLKIDGKHCLLDEYSTIEELEQHLEAFNASKTV